MRIIDWENGARIWGELVGVRDPQLRPPGSNLPQLRITIFDASGQRTATSWDLPESQVDIVLSVSRSAKPLLRISGQVDSSEKYAGQLKITGVSPVSPEELGGAEATDFLESLPPDHDVMVATLDGLIRQVREPNLAALLAGTIGSAGTIRDAFLTACAAKNHHHAYPGGLLRHSLEVTEIALHVTRHFSFLSRDLVITGALLHDIGKLKEMDHGWKRGEYSTAGELVGHIYLGAQRVGQICRRLKFPESLTLALEHLILAHHDEMQFGSPVIPKTGEAILTAKCDQISAELDAFRKAKQEAAGQRSVKSKDRHLFVESLCGDCNAVPGNALPLPDDPEERLIRRLADVANRLTDFGMVRLPILGRVAAGDGIRSSDDADPEERETLMPVGGANYALRVTGDSMTGAGILEGDVLVVRSQETGQVDQIVIAQIPGSGAVVKRLTETKNGRFLSSENPEYAPIPVDEGVHIQGVVVRVERDL